MSGAQAVIKKGRKFDQVLEGARKVFFNDGFEGASVDNIARAAGVSKATLYSYFRDKRLLFMEVARLECCRQANSAIETIDKNAPIREILADVALQVIAFVESDSGQRIYRICVAESERFPELGQAFYESGPVMVRNNLVHLFELGIARGELKIDDKALAAEQFHDLCKTGLFAQLTFNISQSFTKAEKMRVVDGAVDMFMARYGV